MNGKLSEEKLVAFFCFKNSDLLKSYCNKRIRKVIIDGETGADRQIGADGQATDSTPEEKD